MGSVRGLKDLVSALRRQAEHLERELKWAFSASGQNISPADRMAHARQLIELAEIVLGLVPMLASLRDAVTSVEERMEKFVTIHKIPIASALDKEGYET